jgi:hypothetical protein
MVRLLGKKVSGSVSYMDLFGAGLIKYFEERTLAPIIGNGNIKSGAIKLGTGLLARKFIGGGILGDSVSLGFGIDGIEDILCAIIGGGVFGIGTGGGENW